ncbi:oxidoreductase [Coraliomargarita sinensis]|uniref:Oxidoreductase n=1 Tax=Coraliomargarita sinensis TaxID=2174842 RepID=A0A317ZIC4_9BACT|nr:Gfo/Idh/MocA family oxidoreductase [Coraliomargarita sinensis]PXA03963.1 oxidoreductase [Coraliomargarita sinensis]
MNISRRTFSKWAGLGAAATAMPSWLGALPDADSQKLKIAVIGVGGRGKAHIKGLASQHFVAFCDVDDASAAETYKEYPNVPRFKDYRVMFDKMGKEIEAVSIATPDHMHYPIVLWALAHGKHIFCEKPLTRTFEEAMVLKNAVREAGVITQLGNQGHVADGWRNIREWVQAGLAGDVYEAYHWTNRPVWPQGLNNWPKKQPVPASFDWNLWLGVAPKRDYSPGIAPFNWRGFWDYGSGAIGDIACHSMDASYSGLQLGLPTAVSADVSGRSDVYLPKASTITFEFPGIEGRGPVKLTWMDGDRRPSDIPFVDSDKILADEATGKKGMANGSFIVGTKASIFASLYSMYPSFRPREYHKELRANNGFPEETLPRPVEKSHFMEWVNGVKTGTQPGGNIAEYAADFTATALLGTIALGVPGKLEFDPKTQQFTNSEQANRMLRSQYEYRKEFLPG